MPHLFAGIIALGLAAITFFAARRVLIHFEHARIVSRAPESFAHKNQVLSFSVPLRIRRSYCPFGPAMLISPLSFAFASVC